MDQQKIGKFLKHLRKNKELTQEQLAEILDVSQNYIANIERGKANMSLGKILELSKALNLKINVLLNFEENWIFSI